MASFAFRATFRARCTTARTRASCIVLSRFSAMPIGRRGLPQSGTRRTAEVVHPGPGFAGIVTRSCHPGSGGIVSAHDRRAGRRAAGGARARPGACGEGKRGAGRGGDSRVGNDLGGRRVTRMAGPVPPRRAERHGVTSVTSLPAGCGRRHTCVRAWTGGSGPADAGIMDQSSRPPPGRHGILVLGAANGVRKGGFSRSCESPSKARGWAPHRRSCVHSVFRTLRGVIFVNLWRAKRHFTLPYGA